MRILDYYILAFDPQKWFTFITVEIAHLDDLPRSTTGHSVQESPELLDSVKGALAHSALRRRPLNIIKLLKTMFFVVLATINIKYKICHVCIYTPPDTLVLVGTSLTAVWLP